MSTLEAPYNFRILDDIHNLFPEILYDGVLFPGDSNRMINWIRYRLSQLFPQTYRRCRITYELRSQTSARADFDDWLFLLGAGANLRAPVQIQMPPYRNEFISTPPRNNNNINYSPPPINRTSSVRSWGGEETLGLLSLALNIPTENWLASFFDRVPVQPTSEEIERGSELLQSVAEDVICTICQEHDQSPRTGTWRRLRRCAHLFHQNCVDRWFSRNSHCPVCRADIREQTPVNPDSGPSPMESDSSPM